MCITWELSIVHHSHVVSCNQTLAGLAISAFAATAFILCHYNSLCSVNKASLTLVLSQRNVNSVACSYLSPTWRWNKGSSPDSPIWQEWGYMRLLLMHYLNPLCNMLFPTGICFKILVSFIRCGTNQVSFLTCLVMAQSMVFGHLINNREKFRHLKCE